MAFHFHIGNVKYYLYLYNEYNSYVLRLLNLKYKKNIVDKMLSVIHYICLGTKIIVFFLKKNVDPPTMITAYHLKRLVYNMYLGTIDSLKALSHIRI